MSNEKLLKYLAAAYEPDPLCFDEEVDFKCDFRVDDSDKCPCELVAQIKGVPWQKKNPAPSGEKDGK